jgi:hypothetical protein
VQRAAQGPGRAFGIQRGRDRERLRIELDHRIQARPRAVEAFDPFEVGAYQILRTRSTFRLRCSELSEAGLFDCELGAHRRRQHGQQPQQQSGDKAHVQLPGDWNGDRGSRPDSVEVTDGMPAALAFAWRPLVCGRVAAPHRCNRFARYAPLKRATLAASRSLTSADHRP